MKRSSNQECSNREIVEQCLNIYEESYTEFIELLQEGRSNAAREKISPTNSEIDGQCTAAIDEFIKCCSRSQVCTEHDTLYKPSKDYIDLRKYLMDELGKDITS